MYNHVQYPQGKEMPVWNHFCVVLLQCHGKSEEVLWGLYAYKRTFFFLEACNFLIACYIPKLNLSAHIFIFAYLGKLFIEELLLWALKTLRYRYSVLIFRDHSFLITICWHTEAQVNLWREMVFLSEVLSRNLESATPKGQQQQFQMIFRTSISIRNPICFIC